MSTSSIHALLQLLDKLLILADEDKQESGLDSIRLAISQLGVQLMSAISTLETKVAANTSVVNSAVTLLQGIKAQLDKVIADDNLENTSLDALSDSLGKSTDALAAAVAANTPADTGGTAAPAPAPAPADGGDGGATGGDGGATPAPGDDGTGGTGTATP